MDELIAMLRKYALENGYRVQVYRKDNLNKAESVYLIKNQTAIAVTLTKIEGLR